jgi:CRP-like cAMP-binding protein
MGSGGAFGSKLSPRSATVCAVEHTELFRIERADLDNLLDQDPRLGLHIYKSFARVLCGRLRRTSTDLTFMREVARRGRD